MGERLSKLEKKIIDNHKKDQKFFLRLAEEINKNTNERKKLETANNTKIRETASRLWTNIQTLESRMNEQALKQSVKLDSINSQFENLKKEEGSLSTVKEKQTGIENVQKDLQDKIGLLDKELVKMLSEAQDKKKLASSISTDIKTVETKVNEHNKKLLVVESKIDSFIEQKKMSSPVHSNSTGGQLGVLLREYYPRTRQWNNITESNADLASKTFFSTVRPVLHSVATRGGKSVLIIACSIPTTPENVAFLRFPFPSWAAFDSHSFTVQKGTASLHLLRSQLGTSKKQKSVNPALRSMFVELEKYIQAYQFLYRFVAYVDLPPKCLQSILEQEAIHLASLIFLENALALEVQVEATEKKEVTGSNVFMREEDGEFAIKWKKHLSFLKKKEDDHLVFQAFRCSW